MSPPDHTETAAADAAASLQPLGIRVFSATKARDRHVLGEVITEWIRAHPEHQVFEKVVMQSSDAGFHCLTIVLLFRGTGAANPA